MTKRMNQIGRKIIRLESVDSTNNYVANVLREGKVEHGTVILAVEQYAGRGQRNAEWHAVPGENLTFSVFWDKVNLSVDEQFHITRFISLALIRTLEVYGISAKIKWPNDIYVNDRKLAGILIENQIVGKKVRSCVIGIGLNVNQNRFDGLNAVSMALVKGKKFVTDEVFFTFLGILNEFSAGGEQVPTDLGGEYTKKLFLLDKCALFEESNGERFSGIIRGVEDNGKLIMEIEGEKRHVDLREVRFIPQSV